MESVCKLLELLPFIAIVLLASDITARLLFVVTVALAFLPACEHRALKMLTVAAPLLRKVGLPGARRVHERLVIPLLMLAGLVPLTAKRARKILRILGN